MSACCVPQVHLPPAASEGAVGQPGRLPAGHHRPDQNGECCIQQTSHGVWQFQRRYAASASMCHHVTLQCAGSTAVLWWVCQTSSKMLLCSRWTLMTPRQGSGCSSRGIPMARGSRLTPRRSSSGTTRPRRSTRKRVHTIVMLATNLQLRCYAMQCDMYVLSAEV